MFGEGSTFPDFSLPDQDGKLWALRDLEGQRFVVFCYPKDNTSG